VSEAYRTHHPLAALLAFSRLPFHPSAGTQLSFDRPLYLLQP
jgi:hypothetical protein